MPDVSAPVRKHKRIQKNCEVEFSSCANNEIYDGVTENFSVDGLFLRTDDLLPLQSEITIVLHLPYGSTSRLKGVVRRVYDVIYDTAASGHAYKGGMGIEIIERDSHYMRFFISLLSGRLVF
jgi:hypothetical protein